MPRLISSITWARLLLLDKVSIWYLFYYCSFIIKYSIWVIICHISFSELIFYWKPESLFICLLERKFPSFIVGVGQVIGISRVVLLGIYSSCWSERICWFSMYSVRAFFDFIWALFWRCDGHWKWWNYVMREYLL